MSDLKKIQEFTKLWIKNKKSIIDGDFYSSLILRCFKSLSKDGEGFEFSEKGITINDPDTNNAKIVPGFILSKTIPIDEAKLLQRCFKMSKDLFKFKGQLSFSLHEQGDARIELKTTGDYFSEIMERPRFLFYSIRKNTPNTACLEQPPTLFHKVLFIKLQKTIKALLWLSICHIQE